MVVFHLSLPPHCGSLTRTICYSEASMRRLRPLLLVAILIVAAGVGLLFHTQRRAEQRSSPPRPPSLPAGASAAATDWVYRHEKGGRINWEAHAKKMQAFGDPPRLRLEDVELRVLSQDGAKLHRFRTAVAVFDQNQARLHAEGQVEIVAGEPAAGGASAGTVFIRTSGLIYDGATGEAHTDSPASFSFEHGEGSGAGVSYNPSTGDLRIHSAAELVWRGSGAASPPISVEAQEATYKERDAAILLGQWCRFRRRELTVEGSGGFVFLEEGAIRRILGMDAHGADRTPSGRRLEFAAAELVIELDAAGEVQRIHGSRGASLTSVEAVSRTRITAEQLEMDFEPSRGGSFLRTAIARNQALIESRPVAQAGRASPPTRLLRSNLVELRMAAGGESIETVETLAPGVIEFAPNAPGQPRRRMEAARINVLYGANNRARLLRATEVSTRTDYAKTASGQQPPPLLTWSRRLEARFSAAGEVEAMEQHGEFRFDRGSQRGSADAARLEEPPGLLTLEGKARVWDAAGSLSAARIVLDQERGDVSAEGDVASTREPERKGQASVVSAGEPVHARAQKMYMPGGGRIIRYEGRVILWQQANRMEADWVEIDREQRTLSARGNVVSSFAETPPPDSGRALVYTILRAAEMLYEENSRTARYSGGVTLKRGNLEVVSDRLRAVLKTGDEGAALETAYAEGAVRIRQQTAGRSRTGTGEYAEYAVHEERVALWGGNPEFVDSARGATRGARLTWYAANDRLLVDGAEGSPARSRILR